MQGIGSCRKPMRPNGQSCKMKLQFVTWQPKGGRSSLCKDGQIPCWSKCWKLSCRCMIARPRQKDWWKYQAPELLENKTPSMPHQKWIIKPLRVTPVHKKNGSHLESVPSAMGKTTFENASAFLIYGANQAIFLMKIASLCFAR